MTELEAARSELASLQYAISHDLRAPLRIIDGFSQALEEDYPDALEARGREYLAHVRAATQRLAKMVDALLKLSRIGDTRRRRQSVDVSAICQAVVLDLKNADKVRQVRVVISPRLAAWGDPTLLREALAAMIQNAWKFTGHEAKARIEIGSLKGTTGEVFFVRDNGAGFQADRADKLFAPFQRFHHEVDFPGLGVGLALARRVIADHGGRIWAVSTPDHGASFYFTLEAEKHA